jgi:outer membrane receptor protein involved in Fe transport
MLLALALVLSALASADDLGTLTVYGNKENRDLSKTADSAAVLRENDLAPTGRENNMQVLNAVPNVEVNKNGESFSIRGINNTGVTGYQKDNLSSVVLDGLFQTDLALQSGSFTLWDLDQIEVLRGAQSTNQGVNSLAGLVILNRQAPTFLPERGVRVGYGNFGAKDLSAYVNQPVGEKSGLRIGAEKELNNGYITNIYNGNDEWGFWNKERARLSYLRETEKKHQLTLDAKFHRTRQGGTYTQGSDAFQDKVDEDVDAFTRTRNYQGVATYMVPMENRQNTTMVGFSYSDQNSEADADFTRNNTAGTRYEKHRDHYLTAENRLNYRGERWENLFGIHAHDFRLKDDYDFNMLYSQSGITTPVHILQGVNRERRAYALFDSALFRLNEMHALVAGARAEYVESEYSTSVFGRRLQNLGGAGNAAVDAYLNSRSGSYGGRQDEFVILPKGGYQFLRGPHFSALTYTRGYRTSGVSINRTRATAVNYGSEYTNNFELAYRYSLDNLMLASNLFYTDWQDQQVQVQLSNDFFDTQVQNAAKSRVLGGELEGKIDLGRHNLGLGAGYADTKFREFVSQGVNYEGKEFPFASKWTSRFTHRWNVFGNFTWLTTVRYVSKSFANAENTRRADGQFYLHGNARYALGQWIFEGYANNILNSRYRIFDGTPTSTTSPYQTALHQVNTPREYGVKVAYYW